MAPKLRYLLITPVGPSTFQLSVKEGTSHEELETSLNQLVRDFEKETPGHTMYAIQEEPFDRIYTMCAEPTGEVGEFKSGRVLN